MSYIRISQNSNYVNLGEGSREYIYNNGHSISGAAWNLSFGAWIGVLCAHAREAGVPDSVVDALQRDLENHYGEPAGEEKLLGPRPEMAHILAQHLDSRLDGWEYDDEWSEALKQYADSAFMVCPECDTRWRTSVEPREERGTLCQDCWGEELLDMDVSCDTAKMEDFIGELPDSIPPTAEQDEQFYALTIATFMDAEGVRREALAQQLGEAADEIKEAVDKERPVDKEAVLETLEKLDG